MPALLGCLAAGGAACRSDGRCSAGRRVAQSSVVTATGPRLGAPDNARVTREARPTAQARALSDSFEAAAEAIRPCVVRLDVEGRGAEPGLFGSERSPPRELRGTGSGIVIDGSGHILTSGHLLRGMTRVTVRLVDHRSFPGKVLAIDPLTDVGVVQFEKAPPDLVAARLGNSDDLRIGQWVIAVGSPLGMEQTVTAGIVGGVGETGAGFRFKSGDRVRKYIQTDAEINPGNSGGPLVELTGQVVGINTFIDVGPGGSYGFAIPINQASQVALTLIKDGHVRHPFIGVNVIALRDLPDDLPAQLKRLLPEQGALVASVMAGSPAAQAGVRVGDVITQIGGHPITCATDVVAAVSTRPIGGKVSVDLVRDGSRRALDVRLRDYPNAANDPGGGID